MSAINSQYGGQIVIELFTLSSNSTTDMIWPDNSSVVNGTVETAGV